MKPASPIAGIVALLAAVMLLCGVSTCLQGKGSARPAVMTQATVLQGPRSGQWPRVRNEYLAEHDRCEACGSRRNLNVHHVRPFHLYPQLELSKSNLMVFCREHHFTIGHDPDGIDGPLQPDWNSSNPHARADAIRVWEKKGMVTK